MSAEKAHELQKREVIALKNIYGKEFRLLRPKNTKLLDADNPPTIAIELNFSFSFDKVSIIGLKLCFECPSQYPFVPPTIIFQDVKNINGKTMELMKTAIKSKCDEFPDTVMIYELTEFARQYITNTMEKDNVGPVTNHMKEVDEKLKLECLMKRKDSAMRESTAKFQLETCQHHYKTNSAAIVFQNLSDKDSIRISKGICNGVHWIKTINLDVSIVFNTFDGFNHFQGSYVKIHKMSIRNLSVELCSSIMKQWLPRLVDDFSSLSKLDHPNVVTYLFYRYNSTGGTKKSKSIIEIEYVTNNFGGCSLSQQCSYDIAFDKDKNRLPLLKIRNYIRSVLEGVRYLHERNLTSVELNTDSIIVDQNGNIRLLRYCIGKRLEELKTLCGKCNNEGDTSSTYRKGTKRYDLLSVMKLAEELFFFGVTERDETELPSELKSFIKFTGNSADELLQHSFLNLQDKSNDIGDLDKKQDMSAWEIFAKSSRIPTEFKLIEKLGEGAFGDVVKVQNIYDQQFYAIKRVKLSVLTKRATRTIKEVQLLSSLNHENIVRYFSSWSEVIDPKNCKISPSGEMSTTISSLVPNLSTGTSFKKPTNLMSCLSDMSEAFRNDKELFVRSNYASHFYNGSDTDSSSESIDAYEQEETSDDNIVFEGISDHNQVLTGNLIQQKNGISLSSGLIEDYPGEQGGRSVASKSAVKLTRQYLMIQMELCEGTCNTLQKYIETENLYNDEKLIWKFLWEICSGLEHIHSKNMIHRDLKPSNIFIDSHKKVKLGDLGLATTLINKSTMEEGNFVNDGPVGTAMYISPEMYKKTAYNNKTDMYSLGVITFEMCHKPFSTASERYHILQKLCLPEIVFPTDNFEIKTDLKDLIKLLLNHDPSSRPSASYLLSSEIIPPPQTKVMELRKKILECTKNTSSYLYKTLLNSMFNQVITNTATYELPLLYQTPFKQFLSNTNYSYSSNEQKDMQIEIDTGDYTFFSIRRRITELVESAFINHGAVEFMGPLLIPCEKIEISQSFKLLDSEGTVVQLPRNLHEGFVHFVGNNKILRCRRYAIGTVYREQDYRRDHPYQLMEAVMDCICDYQSDNRITEILLLQNEILRKIFDLSNFSLCLEINSTDLFFGVLEFFKVPESLHSRIIYSLQNNSFDEFFECDDFRKLVSLNTAHFALLKQILTFNDDCEKLEQYLKLFFNKASESESCKKIISAFEMLKHIDGNMKMMDNLCFRIALRVGYIPVESFFQGFVYQVVISSQQRFLDNLYKYRLNKRQKGLSRFFKVAHRISHGGSYSNFLRKICGFDIHPNDISANGLTIDVTVLIQFISTLEHVNIFVSEMENTHTYQLNTVTDVVVQYDKRNKQEIQKLLAELRNVGLSVELYDKDDYAEEYVIRNKIRFFIKIPDASTDLLKLQPTGDTSKLQTFNDKRQVIIIKKNDFRRIGLEMIPTDDCNTISKAIDLILKEPKYKVDSFLSKFNKQSLLSYQKQMSDTQFSDTSAELDRKRTDEIIEKKPAKMDAKYLYKFVFAKEFKCSDCSLNFLAETPRQILFKRAKIDELQTNQVQAIIRANTQILSISKWFGGRIPSPMYILIIELSLVKCLLVSEEASLKNLKDQSKLSFVFSKIQESKGFDNNSEKNWKDVVSGIWNELQEAARDKINRVVLYSQIDDQISFLELK